MLLAHATRFVCSLAFRSAGINIAIKSAIMAITTKSSINVNPTPLVKSFLTGLVRNL